MLNYKYTILYTFLSLFLFWIIIKYGNSLIKHKLCPLIEGLTEFEKYSQMIIPYPKDSLINYNDINSPLYSHTVNLPINDTVSCKNFCGPKSQCAITREQCTSDIDCQGCNPGPPPKNDCISKDVEPYDDGGKLGQNQLQYSPLTTGYNNHRQNFEEAYPGSKESQLKRTYNGEDNWTKSFNEGLGLYNKRQESRDKYNIGESDSTDIPDDSKLSHYEPKYPTTISATGMFYQTTPPASNS
jgi:hypothetical protein